METEEYCKPEDSKNIAIPFLPFEKGIVHFILSLLEATTLSSITYIYLCTKQQQQIALSLQYFAGRQKFASVRGFAEKLLNSKIKEF